MRVDRVSTMVQPQMRDVMCKAIMAAMLCQERGSHLQSCMLYVGTKRQPRVNYSAIDCLTKVPAGTVDLSGYVILRNVMTSFSLTKEH